MAVNLSKNGTSLMDAYKAVVDGKTDTNWALFTYEGNNNDIRVAETGEGGLEEMVEELNSGKVMYAFCRVQDPNSGLPKYVLINWFGEGVKDSRKAQCANHVRAMATFLKGAHVTIHARGDDDVEPGEILQKVSKASGANFHFKQEENKFRDAPRGPVGSVYRKVNAVEEIQSTNKEDFWNQNQRDEEMRRKEESKRAEMDREKVEKERRETDERQARERERSTKEAPRGTVGSTYRKVNAMEEIQNTNKDDFWNQNQRDEEMRRKEESKRAEMEREKVEKERRETDERQARERERSTKERARQIEVEKKSQKQREEEEREKEQQKQNSQPSEYKKSGINSAASVQKANEAKSLISQREFNPRDVFKKKEESSGATDRHTPNRPGKLQSPFLSQESTSQEIEFEIPMYKPHRSPAASLTPRLSPELPVSLSPGLPVSLSPELSHSPALPVSLTPEPIHSPVRAAVEEEEWSDEFEDDTEEAAPEPAPAAVQEDLYEAPKNNMNVTGTQEEDLYESVYHGDTPAVENNAEARGRDITARAIYDYQAADESEITFDPDDIITGIEMVDEGWWRGCGPDGHHGMFPANYVELI